MNQSPVENEKQQLGLYISETQKIRPKIQKYLGKTVVDIGAGQDKISPEAFGIDARPFPHINFVTNSLYSLPKQIPHLVGKCDTIYSSHTLEHIPEDIRALHEWGQLLKVNGYMVLYLPDDRWYDNESNPEHLRSFTYPQFLRFFKRTMNEFKVVESGEDYGPDKYSFYIVAQKIENWSPLKEGLTGEMNKLKSKAKEIVKKMIGRA